MAGRGLEQDKEREVHSYEAVGSLLSDSGLRVDDEHRTLFEAIEQGVAIAEVILNDAGEGVDYRIIDANEAFAALMSRPRAELLSGKTARELISTLTDFWPHTMGQVAVTGEPARFEKYSASLDRHFEIHMVRVGDPSLRRVASIYNDITARRRAERTLQFGQRVKAYLLKLSVQLRPIERPVDIMSAAAEAVARELNVAAAGYIEMAEDGETALTGGQFGDGRLPAFAGTCKLSEFGEGIGVALKAGQDLFVPDILAFAQGPEGGTEKARDFKLRAAAAIPLIKDGRLVAFFYAVHHEPRPWEGWEKEIFRQTAEWTWAAVERARAETAFRENLEKYRTLFDSIDQAYSVIEMIYEDGVPKDFRVIEGNRVFGRQTGLADYRGKTARDLVSKVEDYWLGTYARVAETGEPVRFENYSEGMGRWFNVFASRVGGEGSRLVSVVFDDITERKESEAARRTEGDRLAYRWKLSDALRPLADPAEIQESALKVLNDRLGADRIFYGQVHEERQEILIERDSTRREGAGAVGRYSMGDVAWLGPALEAGRPVVVEDVNSTSVVPEADRPWVAEKEVGAFIVVPLLKEGHVVAMLCVTEQFPRVWTPLEVELAWHTGERTWAALARARAEAALRASEEKYRGLFNSIDQGYAVIEVLFDSNGAPRDLYFHETNRIFEQLTGQDDYHGKTAKGLNPNLEEFWVRMYADVVASGQPARFERHVREIDKWFTVLASRLGGDGSHLVNVVFDDISERKRAEGDLREREERKAYMLQLSDSLRRLGNPFDVQQTACRLLGEKIGADRAFYTEIDEEAGSMQISLEHLRGSTPSVCGRYQLSDFEWLTSAMRDARIVVVNDTQSSTMIPEEGRARMAAVKVGSFIGAALIKDNVLVAKLCVANVGPRVWTEAEAELVRETADRTWAAAQGARAIATVRASEEKYRTLFDAIDSGIAVIELLYDEHGAADCVRFIEANDVFRKQTGLSDPIGKTSRELIPNLEDSCIEKYARVVATGEPVSFESYSHDFDIWMNIFASRLYGPGSRLINVVFDDITQQKRAEIELREREERKAYQLRLADALGPLTDPAEIQGTATRLLGERLRADRALYVEIDEANGEVEIARDFVRGEMSSVAGRHKTDVSAWVTSTTRRGRPTVVNDVDVMPFVQPGFREKALGVGVASFVAVPLVKNDRLAGALCVATKAPRIWTPAEVERVQDTADRARAAVEHARAEIGRRASEEKYTTLFNAIDQGIAVVEVLYNENGKASDLRFIETNRVWERQNRITGAAGKTSSELLPQLGLPCVRRYAKIAETGVAGRFETYIEETGIWLDIYATRVGGAESRVVSIVFNDVTERKKAEVEVRASEERKAFLLKLSDALRPHSDSVEVQGTVTRMLCEHLGADRAFYAEIDETLSEAVVQRDYARAGTPSLVGRYPLEVFGWMASSPKKGESAMVDDVRTTTLIPEADRAAVAAVQVFALMSVPLLKNNRVVGALCVTQMRPRAWKPEEFELVKETAERTWAAVERARAEVALRKSEERLQRVLETDAVGVLFFDWTGTVTHANDVFTRMTGYTPEEIAERKLTWHTLTPEEFIPSCERHVAILAETGRLGPLEKEYIMKDGSRRWMLLAGRDLGDGTISEYCIDITDRKRAESALRESEERFRLFLENVHEYAFVQCDTELRITSWNPGAERIFGYSSQEALGQPFTLLLAPEDHSAEVPCMKISELERKGRSEDARWLVRKDGQRIWARWVSEPVRNSEGHVTGLTKVLRDETERLRAETSLRESEKLAVVGRMASSIAHEINNPLEAVTNLIYLARKVTDSQQVADFLDVAQSELARVSHISKATLHFHRQSSEPYRVDVEEILESVLLLHEGRLRAAQIETERRYGPHPPIRCKENEIRQVVANLVSNALDAMTKNGDDRRRMIVRVRKAADARTGEEGVRVMIADTGAGIQEESSKRVFEPFYTTKAATGTGLGLWISSEAVRKHQGTLRFRSRTDGHFRGTVFSMFLKS
jgi:PAS domain S-box-containing protein